MTGFEYEHNEEISNGGLQWVDGVRPCVGVRQHTSDLDAGVPVHYWTHRVHRLADACRCAAETHWLFLYLLASAGNR